MQPILNSKPPDPDLELIPTGLFHVTGGKWLET